MSTGSLEALETELQRGLFRPIYFLEGPEELLRRQAESLFKRYVVPPEAWDFNGSEFSAKSASLGEILSCARTFPFTSTHRLVIVTDLDALPTAAHDPLSEYLEEPAAKTVLVLSAAALDRRTSLFRRLKQRASVLEFPRLQGTALQRWAEQLLKSRGFRMAPGSLEKLLELVAPDLQVLAGEIEKLMLYAGENKSIPDSVVEELVRESRQHNIFELTGAIGRKDHAAALRLLGTLLESGEHPLVVVTMVARHFRQVLIAKEMLARGMKVREIGAAAQVPYFVLDAFLRQARSIDADRARAMYRRLAEADYRFKSSSVDQRMILEGLLCAL